jgi:hypothetical protein
MDLSGDGIKHAVQLFKKAAWVFNNLITASTQLPAGYSSVDFHKEALTMNRELCLAQAQYLFFKKATDAGMAGNVLSKVAAQTAIYFDNAHKENQVNNALRGIGQGKFANVLGYHARYFKAQAYWHLGNGKFKEADSKGKGMAAAFSYLAEAVRLYGEAQPFANALGGAYKGNFDAKLAACRELAAKAESDNKSIYYEPNVNVNDLPKPDPQNYVALESCAEDINKPAELDQKLRHLVPPEVRANADELKNQV